MNSHDIVAKKNLTTIAKIYRTHDPENNKIYQIDTAATEKYNLDSVKSAHGSIVSAVFYVSIQIDVGNYEFNGKGGTFAVPGAGACFGNLYILKQNLFTDTVSFEFNSTPAYFSTLFFDSNSTLLGHFQAGQVGIVTGIGGGSGSWKQHN